MEKEIYMIDLAYPFFCAMVVSAFICVFALFPPVSAHLDRIRSQNAVSREAETPPDETLRETAPEFLAPVIPPSVQLLLAAEGFRPGEDKILAAYRDPAVRNYVTAFFGDIIHSRELAGIILSNADVYDIPPSLAFALCWEESRFKVQAIGRRNQNGSVDRGLFQLNNKSFPYLSEKEFFDSRINSRYGLSHLRWCLDAGGSLVSGLAMYNAGTNRVSAGGAPKTTLDYVSSILNTRARIEALFEEHRPELPEIVLAARNEETDPEEQGTELARRPRLAFLSPAL
jgi:hypothetical protein